MRAIVGNASSSGSDGDGNGGIVQLESSSSDLGGGLALLACDESPTSQRLLGRWVERGSLEGR